jgi:hypothetical protein
MGVSTGDETLPEQEVLDCLDATLSSLSRHARIDTAGPLIAGELVTKFEQRAAKEVALHMRRIPPELRRPTYAFFCENEAYGASAIRDRYDFVVLNIGIVPVIVDFCGRMMAAEELWASVGKTASASATATTLQSGFPDDPVRMAFAVVFAGECFDFIVRHELAHLVLGHCEFLAAKGQSASTEDSDGRVRAGVDAIAVQTLELAADGHAAIWGVEKLPRIRERLGRLPSGIDEACRWFHITPNDSMRNYLLAMFFVFRLFDERVWDNATLANLSHPPAPIRFHAACIHLAEHFKTSGNTEAEGQLLRAIQEVWPVGEIMFAEALGRTPDHLVLRRTMSKESEQHYELLSNRARTLPPSLFGLS